MQIKNFVKMTGLVFFVLLSMMCTITAFAATRTQMILEYNSVKYEYDSPEITLSINDKKIEPYDLKIPPIIIDDRTYVPVRDVFEKMGAVVDWKEDTSQVFIGYGNRLIILKINERNIYIDGENKMVEVAPLIVNNRTMIPVKFASEAMGFEVGWDGINKIVSLNDKTIIKNDLQTNENPLIDTNDNTNTNTNSDSTSIVKTIELAKDVSNSSIPEVTYPSTKIIDIILPTSETISPFKIVTSSEISKVKKMLLEDNRLIIDIYNAEIALNKSEYVISNNSFISKIRTGQNQIEPEMISRVVFDLKAAVSYSISISADRKEILISFEQNIIKDVSFSSDGISDYIKIEGEIPPIATVMTLTNPERIVIDIPFGVIEDETIATNGMFVSSLRTAQFEETKARVVLDLKEMPTYKVSTIGNITTIQILKANYKNIKYDFNDSVIVIPKKQGNTIIIDSINHIDNYTKNKYILELNADYSDFFGEGEYPISDSGIRSIGIETVNAKTSICINETQILAFNVYEDNSNIYIKPISPKEKYSKIVVIDPGHGGKFVGTVGNGLQEKDINLSIALKVIKMLEDDGRIKVYSIRLEDMHLNEDLTKELLMRSAIANAIGDLYVSIHNNAFTEASNGTETYYDKKNNELAQGNSKKAADIMQKKLLEALGFKDRKVQTDNFSVLRNTKIPAILTEVGFISNPEEAAKLATDEYQTKAAIAIFEAIIEMFETYSPSR